MRHYTHPSFHDVVRLDFEHAEQLRLLREFAAALEAGVPTDDLRTRLVEYNRSHFQLEEMLMEEHAYADGVAHAAEHAELLESMLRLSDIQAVGECATRLKRHNGERDVRLASFLDRRNAFR